MVFSKYMHLIGDYLQLFFISIEYKQDVNNIYLYIFNKHEIQLKQL